MKRLRQWFDGLAERERKLLLLLMAVFAIVIVLLVPFGISSMLSERREHNEALRKAIQTVGKPRTARGSQRQACADRASVRQTSSCACRFHRKRSTKKRFGDTRIARPCRGAPWEKVRGAFHRRASEKGIAASSGADARGHRECGASDRRISPESPTAGARGGFVRCRAWCICL